MTPYGECISILNRDNDTQFTYIEDHQYSVRIILLRKATTFISQRELKTIKREQYSNMNHTGWRQGLCVC